MTIPSAGTTITDNTYTNIVYVTYNGITREDLNFGRQANAVTSVSTPTGGTLTAAAIPASGGTINSGTVGGTVSQTRTFTSGATAVYTVSTPTGGTFNSVTAPSLGTTIKNSTVVGTLTYTYTLNGKTGTIGTTIAQQGNFVTNLAITGGALSYANVAAAGGNGYPIVSTQTVTYTFTSGSTSTTAPSTTYGSYSFSVKYSLESVKNGFSSITDGGVISATSRGTEVGPARSSALITRVGTGTWTPTSDYNGQGVKTATTTLTSTCTQNENKVTKLEAAVNNTSTSTVHFYYPNQPIPASGGTLNVSGNGKGILTFSSGSVVTESSFAGDKYGGTLTYSRNFSMPATTGFTLNTSTGAVTGANRTTTTGDARTSGVITSTLTLTFTHPASMGSTTVSGTLNGTQTVHQQANAVTSVSYGSPSVTLTVSDIAAAGGTISSGTVTYSQSRTQNYTSGSTSALSALTTGGTVTYSAAVKANSLGTTVKVRTKVGTLTATVTMNSKSGNKTVDVYQAANAATSITYGTPSVSVTCADVPASGGSVTSGTVTYSQSRTQNYTSGSTSTLSALTSGGTVA